MKKNILRTLLTVILFVTFNQMHAQGCSDAGFCTMESFKPHDSDSVVAKNNQFKIGFSFGSADNDIAAIGNYLEYNRTFNPQFGIDAKLTSLSQFGNDISTYGLSDIYINANYKPSPKLSFTLGAKIPLSNGNKTNDNIPLPMDYQSSLGTFDLIFGVGYEFKKIQFVAAIQQPLTQNSNQFVAENYPANSALSTFQTTHKFKRSGDLLLRISYPVNLGEKLRLTPSILPIYHLTNDKYTDALGIEKPIEGSEGLTLNGNLYLDYAVTKNNALQLNLGMPFLTRTARPDGLTRSFAANIEYRIRF